MENFNPEILKILQNTLYEKEFKDSLISSESIPPDWELLFKNLADIRSALESISSGDLSVKISSKGYLAGILKNLQASLKHLTWQVKAISEGDYTQKVDFLGEFSEAFNSMTQKLEETVNDLKISELRHRLLADNSMDVIWTMDLNGKFTYISPSVKNLLGLTPDEFLKKDITEILTKTSMEIFSDGMNSIREAVGKNEIFPDYQGELENIRSCGTIVITEATITGMFDGNGEFIGILGISRDITKRKALEEQIRKLSYTDKLTGLYNRLKLDEELDRIMESLSGENFPFVIAMIDIDHFKKVNDTFGHQTGDIVLQKIAGILLTESQNLSNIVSGRWGGEEFIIFFPGHTISEASLYAQNLCDEIANSSFPGPDRITVSIGLAEYQAGESGYDLVSRADEALYTAKRTGRNRVCVGTQRDGSVVSLI